MKKKDVMEIVDKYVKSFCHFTRVHKDHEFYRTEEECRCVLHKLKHDLDKLTKG